MSEIRNNPPESVVDYEEIQMYKTLYDDITDNGVLLQYQDRHALGELATMQCEMNRLRQSLRTDGEWVKVQGDRNKIMKRNPARDSLEKIRPKYTQLLKEFKMTPGSRGKQTGVPESGKLDDGFDKV